MDRTQGANYDGSSGYRLFTDGPPGTTVEEEFLNGIQEEIVGSIEAVAATPSISDRTQLMGAIGMMGLGMRNGVITPSVAGGGLTVAIKTLAGNDPTSISPVYVRIGNTLRKITSALYITLATGTDDWDRTSYTYSLFVYLGWDSVNSRVEILLCPQPTYHSYPVANPAAPDPKRLRSAYGSNTGTAIISGHTMQLVGRIDGLIQSGADAYTAVTSTALSYPIYSTPILASPEVPTKTNVADTTPVFTTNLFYYVLNYNKLIVHYYFNGDGGVDGAGVAGVLGLRYPFHPSNDVTWIVGGSSFISIAGLDGSNNNTGLTTFTTAGNPIAQWYCGALAAGTGLVSIVPNHVPNGGRAFWGSNSLYIEV